MSARCIINRSNRYLSLCSCAFYGARPGRDVPSTRAIFLLSLLRLWRHFRRCNSQRESRWNFFTVPATISNSALSPRPPVKLITPSFYLRGTKSNRPKEINRTDSQRVRIESRVVVRSNPNRFGDCDNVRQVPRITRFSSTEIRSRGWQEGWWVIALVWRAKLERDRGTFSTLAARDPRLLAVSHRLAVKPCKDTLSSSEPVQTRSSRTRLLSSAISGVVLRSRAGMQRYFVAIARCDCTAPAPPSVLMERIASVPFSFVHACTRVRVP